MRIGKFAQGPIELAPGDRFALTTDEVEGNQQIVSVIHDSLGADVQSGEPHGRTNRESARLPQEQSARGKHTPPL